MLGAQVTLPVHDTMLRHLITHPATRFILPKMQSTTKDSTIILYKDQIIATLYLFLFLIKVCSTSLLSIYFFLLLMLASVRIIFMENAKYSVTGALVKETKYGKSFLKFV
jgi:hypothetical protein